MGCTYNRLFSSSGLHWKLPVAVLLLAAVLFLYEQSFGECGMFHYWYSRAGRFKHRDTFHLFHGTPLLSTCQCINPPLL